MKQDTAEKLLISMTETMKFLLEQNARLQTTVKNLTEQLTLKVNAQSNDSDIQITDLKKEVAFLQNENEMLRNNTLFQQQKPHPFLTGQHSLAQPDPFCLFSAPTALPLKDHRFTSQVKATPEQLLRYMKNKISIFHEVRRIRDEEGKLGFRIHAFDEANAEAKDIGHIEEIQFMTVFARIQVGIENQLHSLYHCRVKHSDYTVDNPRYRIVQLMTLDYQSDQKLTSYFRNQIQYKKINLSDVTEKITFTDRECFVSYKDNHCLISSENIKWVRYEIENKDKLKIQLAKITLINPQGLTEDIFATFNREELDAFNQRTCHMYRGKFSPINHVPHEGYC